MWKTRFSDDQMVNILREADRDSVVQVAKRHGASEQTIYTWRQRCRGMSAGDVKTLCLLEQENARLKKLLVVTCLPKPEPESHPQQLSGPKKSAGHGARSEFG